MNSHDLLWDAHLKRGDTAARDRLLHKHIGLVHHMARRLSRSLPKDVELADLTGAGTIGLVNAVDSFEPDRGVAFSTFAAPRIRGAILDELRARDPLPRSVRRKARELERGREVLGHRLGRTPTPAEISEYLDIDPETYASWHAAVDRAEPMPLEGLDAGSGERERSPYGTVAGATGGDTEDRLGLEQEVDVLKEALLGLKEQERAVLTLHYFENLKQRQIATVLELTESRISQIRSAALKKLRQQLAPLRAEAA